jgi:S-adenosylmethionine decarboxylase proenzyme
MRPQETPTLHAAELLGCARLSELTAGSIMAAFAEALTGAGATVVQTASHCFPGGGLTCVLILAESHAVLHTWPESGTASLDIFSCSPRLKSHAAIHELGRAFGATSVSIQELARAAGHSQPSAARAVR